MIWGRRIGMLAVFLFCVSVTAAFAEEISPSDAATTNYGVGTGKKLGRGLANLGFGWLDIPKGIESVGNDSNFLAAITWGPIYGTGNAIVRTLAGAYEVLTFPIPHPANFEPLVQPEFVIETR